MPIHLCYTSRTIRCIGIILKIYNCPTYCFHRVVIIQYITHTTAINMRYNRETCILNLDEFPVYNTHHPYQHTQHHCEC